jgi:hypothetical protein
MGVHIDSARKHQQSCGVMDDHIRADGQVHADGMHAAVIHQDIRRVVVYRRDDAAIPDERRCHFIPPRDNTLSFAVASLRTRHLKLPIQT